MSQNNEYIKIIKDTAKILVLAKEKGVNADRHQIAELYGIYYNAFAGALRSGVMYCKEMDIDGYPKIVISIGNIMYPCRDIALKDILGDEYEKLTKFPYEDKSASYVRHYTPAISQISDEYSDLQKEMKKEFNSKGVDQVLQKKETAIIRSKERTLKKEAHRFQYDPNYDHFYSERLPDILMELDSIRSKIYARITCISLSVSAIVLILATL